MDARALVGLNLARIRREQGLTQRDLESRSQISQQYLSAMESGAANPSLIVLETLAKTLGVSLFVLLEGVDELPPPPKPSRKQRVNGEGMVLRVRSRKSGQG